jgi:hypothetical protein
MAEAKEALRLGRRELDSDLYAGRWGRASERAKGYMREMAALGDGAVSNVTGLTELPRLALLLAARATGLLNYAGISRDLGMPQTTVKRYLALLETAFLVLTVPAWFRNIGKRLIKSPKLILSDAGLLAHLLGEGAALERSFGAVLENFVLMEIVKQAGTTPARPAVFHYRSADGLEVDALIEPRGGPICAVEVKAAASLSPRDSRGLLSLASALGDEFGAGAILHTGTEAVRLAPKIWALPLAALWAPGNEAEWARINEEEERQEAEFASISSIQARFRAAAPTGRCARAPWRRLCRASGSAPSVSTT